MKRLTLSLAAALALTTSAFAQEATREIQNVAGDVYRFQNNFHFALVVPTSEAPSWSIRSMPRPRAG